MDSKVKIKKGGTFNKEWHGWIFISPVILGILFFSVLPMAESLYYSFFEKFSFLSKPIGFGLKNYIKLFSKDADFLQSIKVTAIYSVITIPLSMTLSFLLALLLNTKLKSIGVFRVLIYVPVVLPVTISGIVWRNLTDVDYGLFNIILSSMGVGKFTFFESAKTAMFSLIFTGLWGLGGGMILWLSALKNVPVDLYEAADIDGAKKITKLFTITIPMCSSMILYNLIMSIIGSLQTFGGVYTLTGGSPGPDNSLLFYLMKVYNDAFNLNGRSMGYACAASWILFIVIALLSMLVFKTSKWVYYGDDN